MMYIQYCIHLYIIQRLFPVIIITIYFFQIDRIKNEINRNAVIVTDYILTSLEIYVKPSTDTLSDNSIIVPSCAFLYLIYVIIECQTPKSFLM